MLDNLIPVLHSLKKQSKACNTPLCPFAINLYIASPPIAIIFPPLIIVLIISESVFIPPLRTMIDFLFAFFYFNHRF
jgi:hypothetical protein